MFGRPGTGTLRRARWAAALVGLVAAISLAQPTYASLAVTQDNSGPAQVLPPEAQTQTSEGGRVTVKVTWEGPSAGLIFQVAMDTHSVNLDAFDLLQLATLRTDESLEVQPIAWDAPAGGHHRGGTLTFPASTADGTPLIGPNTRLVELVIRDVAVPERVLQWAL